MKRCVFTILFLFVSVSAIAQSGYQIKVRLYPFTKGTLYLGHHFGSKQYIVDSAVINNKGEATFSGNEKLFGGVYMVIYPQKNGWFELLIDKQQHFEVTSDTADIVSKTQFSHSTDNELFQDYQKVAQEKGKAIAALQQRLKANAAGPDTVILQSQIAALHGTLQAYRTQFMDSYPNHLLTAIFHILQEPKIPDAAHQPGGKYDSAFAYQFYRQHYWDGISFTDERLVRTPVFEAKLQRYFSNVLPQQPDSLSKAANKMLDASLSNKEMFKFLLATLTEKYINPAYMGQDAVFVNLFERYYAPGKADYWLNDKYRKAVFDRAYNLMANLIGEKAADMIMVDSSGKPATLYSIKAPYIVICFWDPTCGHCQKEIPQLDSLYQNKWKSRGVQLYGVMTDGGKEAWLRFIREHHLRGWNHVYQLPAVKDAEYAAGKPGYKQLYDVYQTPVLYLLDKDKNIIAKKLNHDQLDQLLQTKWK